MRELCLFFNSASERKTLTVHSSSFDLDPPINVSAHFPLSSWLTRGISVSELEVFFEGGFQPPTNAEILFIASWPDGWPVSARTPPVNGRQKRTGGGLFHSGGSSDD